MICKCCNKETSEELVYCANCGSMLEDEKKFITSETLEPEKQEISEKSRVALIIFSGLLGALGVHRFYIGKNGSAIVILILNIIGWVTIRLYIGFIFLIPVWIWLLIDFICAVAGIMKDKDGKIVKNW